MTAPQVLLIGDSHIDAIKRAIYHETRSGSVALPVHGFRMAKMKNETLVGDLAFEAFLERIGSLTANDLVVSAIGGNQHSVFGLVQHPISFDFEAPERPDLAPLQGHEQIPYRLLWDQFESGLRGRDGAHVERLRGHTPARLVHLSPPAPKEDAGHILKRHEVDFAKAGILQRGVTAASVRLKLWHLQISVLQKLCTEWQVHLMPVPAASLTAEGYLKPEYYAEDATHANPAYGALVLEDLRRFATTHVHLQG